MPDKIVDVPGVGTVAFPDTMSDDAVGKAISANYKSAMPPIPDPTRANSPDNPINRVQAPLTPREQMGWTNAQYEGWDKPTFDLNKVPLYTNHVDPNSTNKVSIAAQHVAKFAADQTTPKNAAILGGATVAGPLIGMGVEAAGPALGYSADAVASGAAKAVQGAHRVMAGYFGAMGAKGTLDNYRKTVADAVAGKPITGDVTDTVLNAGMAYLGGKGFLDSEVPKNGWEAGQQVPYRPAVGPEGLIHDGTPPTNTQSPASPVVGDHPTGTNSGSVASNPDNSTTRNESSVTSSTPPNAAGAFDLLGRPTEDDAYKLGTKGDQGIRVKPLAGLLPAPTLEANGEALPPQKGEAGPMSPEAEATSKAAQDSVSQQAPSTQTTEGPTAQVDSSDTHAKALEYEDKIRKQTGQVMRLDQLVKGNQIHAALERGVDDYQKTVNRVSRTVGPGISPEDQKTISIALGGEPVGRTLTPDQVDKAYALRGKVMSDTPVIQNRPDASDATIQASREAMIKDLANTEEPTLKAKLQKALESDENGDPKKMVYKPQYKNAEAVDLPSDHPEAPFSSKTFGAAYPDITMKNWEVALGGKVRSLDNGMGDPVFKKVLAQQKAQVTAEGKGTVKTNPEGFSYEAQNNPKGYNGDLKADYNQFLENSVRATRDKIAVDLRNNVKAYQSLRDASQPSPLIDQLKGIHPDTLPQEVRELVKPSRSKTSETAASASIRTRPQTAEARNGSTSSPTTTLGKAKAGLVDLYSHFENKAPEHLTDARNIIQTASDHFGNDTDGAVVASYHALKVFKQGIENDSDWAMRDAIKVIRRLTPADQTMGGAPTARKLMRETTLYSGIDPTLAKNTAQYAVKTYRDLRNAVMPKLTHEDLIASSDFAANAALSRYEKMTPVNRAVYKAALHSDELDRLVAEGDPDGSKGYQDRLDALRKTTKPSDLYSGIKALVSDNEQRLVSADVSQMIRRENGYLAGNNLKMETLVNKFSSTVDRWSNYEMRDFTDKMERGIDQGDALKNQLAAVLRKALDDARDRINGVNGNFQDFLENYFPHIWANVGQGAELSKQLRGLSGNESFLKNRELDLYNMGIEKGLQPVTYNPLKQVAMRVEQMNRYAMKEQIKKEFVNSNNATFIEPGKPVPDGWVALDDRAFEAAGGLGGRYYAPREVAKIFNNFTSTGLSGKGVIPFTNLSAYDALRATNNTLNQFQLGLSGLHGAFTLTNSILSEVTRGAVRAINGDVNGGLNTVLGALDVKGRYDLGRNLIAHLKDQNSFQELSSLGDALQRAGGRVGMSRDTTTSYSEAFKQSYRDAMDEAMPSGKKAAAWGKTVANGVGTALEAFSSPIMDHMVPKLKIGAFAKMANEILADNVGRPQAEIDAKLQQAWDNVDDRFGQMVYDNLFWNKTAKDIAMLTTRAPGWNIGTYRGLGMGLFDLAKSVKDATKGERFKITDRTAYLGVVLASTMAINAMLQTAMTGSGPSTLTDYFYPKTGTKDGNGEDNRLMPKMYTYDYINAVHDPVGTTLHKVSPLFGTMGELYANKSFYGREIYDPGSSVGARMAQIAGYAIKQYEPFSVSNYQEGRTRGASGLMPAIGSYFGVNPAPKWAGRSRAENLAGVYHAQSMAQGGEAGDVFDKNQKFAQIQADITNGKISSDELTKRVQSGEIPVGLIDHLFSKQQTPNLERWTKGLNSPQRAMEVFDLATPQEKERLMPIMVNYLDKLDPSQMQAYADKLTAAQHHPDTHVFSVSQWSAAHPGEDEKAAETQARSQGYEVHP